MKVKIFTLFYLLFLLSISSTFQSCVDPIEPEFDYLDNLIFIDAYALTEPGISSATIKRSVFALERYSLESVSNAQVKLENVDTGEFVEFTEDEFGTYACPPDFASVEGERWKFYATLADGRKIESKIETVTEAVAIDQLKADFSDEVRYDATSNEFQAGHSVKVDWKDPAGTKNFYLWKHRTFEPLTVCKTCVRGVCRNGVCVEANIPPWAPQYYDYLCETDCWMIRYGDQLPIFSDRLSDGTEIIAREIAAVPYFRAQDVLVEVQQLTLNESSYDYFKIINQLVSENSGLNAPPPSALIGNLISPDDEEEVILGQFTAAGVSTKRIFIDRSNILASPVDPDPNIRLEDCAMFPCSYPCEDSFFRTGTKPEGWP